MIFRVLFLMFVGLVLISYTIASWFGWEVFSSKTGSRLGIPYTSGFRGGK
jgi:hypothetical protein